MKSEIDLIYDNFLIKPTDLTTEELEELLNQFNNGYKADYKERNVLKIEKILERRKRREKIREEKEELWKKLALEDKAIKDEWLQHGAYFIDKGIYVKWYYKDEMFYQWWSRVRIEEEHPRLLKVNEKFKVLKENDCERD